MQKWLSKNKGRIFQATMVLVVAFLIGGFFWSQQKNQDLKVQVSQLKAELNDAKSQTKPETTTLKDILEFESNSQANEAEVVEPKPSKKEAPQKEPANAPQINASPQVHDFGTIRKQDGPVSTTINLSNEGSAPLVISYAFASCGCTTAPIEKQTLQPGESTNFDVSYDPNYYGEYYDLGQVEKKITVLSNDPNQPFYSVKLRANVTR